MQRLFNPVGIGACAGLAVLFGTAMHCQAPLPSSHTQVARATVTHAPFSSEAYGRLPLSFEKNQGQVDKQVAFLSHGPGYNLFLTSNQAVLTLHKPGIGGKTGVRGTGIGDRGHSVTRSIHFSHGSGIVNDPHTHLTNLGSRSPNPDPRTPIPDAVLRLKLLGANAHPEVSGVGELPGNVNYFIGNDPTKWRTQVPTYGRVAYKQVYPGIDMVYYGNQRQLEYDWIVAPGADVHQIQLGVKGAEKITLTPIGDLVLHTAGGDVMQHAPIAYQEIDGVRKSVSSRLALCDSSSGKREHRLGFEVGVYDHTHPLVIDPVLVYSTYLGGTGTDTANGIAVDSVGNAYIVGQTLSVDFPTEAPFQSTYLSTEGGYNVFVSALNASGTALLYSTYIGGSGDDIGYGIALDSSMNVYITGVTAASDFPIKNPYQSANHAGSAGNVFVTKLNATGSALIYSTYLGGSSGEEGFAIAVDHSNTAYVTGLTLSSDFPLYDEYQNINHSRSTGTAFVTKLNAAGSALVYSTFLGGSGGDAGLAIAADNGGDAYVTGRTNSSDFPLTPNAIQGSKAAGNTGSTAFVTKIDDVGNGLAYSTYLGGSISDQGSGIAVDSAYNAYITGQTSSKNFPTAGSHVFQSTNHGGTNAFLTKINAAGSTMTYSTYLGGSTLDTGNAVAVDSNGNAYVTGVTYSGDFPVLYPTQPTLNGESNAYLVKLNSVGSALLYSTYLGGSASDSGSGVAVDSYGNAYVTGVAQSVNFPVQNPLQATNHTLGDGNAFIARIGNYNWQSVDVAVGSDNKSRMLWKLDSGYFTLWSVDAANNITYGALYNPVGWTVQAMASGADGLTRVLWHKTDGTAALWLVNANNSFVNGFNFGPYAGWSAIDVTVGSENKARLLWAKSDGTVGVWTVDNSGNLSNLTNIGPYAGYSAPRLAAGSDGFSRLLWTKNDGTVVVWLLTANNVYKSGTTCGQFTGWRGIDLSVGSDNKTRLLWNKSDGTAGVWTVDNNGVTSNLANFGPYAGWTAAKIAAGGDGLSRLLWYKGDGTQGLWLLNANNGLHTETSFGPY